MQFEFEEQKKSLKAEIDKLEKIIKAKNQEIEKLQTTSSWEVAENNNDVLIKDQLEAVKKMNEAFQQDIFIKTR